MMGFDSWQRRVPGGAVLEPRDGDDVPGAGHVDALALVGVHLQQAGHFFLFALRGVEDLVARFQEPRVDAA